MRACLGHVSFTLAGDTDEIVIDMANIPQEGAYYSVRMKALLHALPLPEKSMQESASQRALWQENTALAFKSLPPCFVPLFRAKFSCKSKCRVTETCFMACQTAASG